MTAKPKIRRKLLLCGLGAFLLVLAILYGAAHSYLNSDGFQKKLITEVADKFRCTVKLEKMRVHLLRGMDLVNIHVQSRDMHPKTTIHAERLRVRYDFYEALFHQRVVLEEVRLTAPKIEIDLSEVQVAEQPQPVPPPPVVALDENATPDDQDSAVEEVKPVLPKELPKKESVHRKWPQPPALDLRKVVVEDGAMELLMPNQKKFYLKGVQVNGASSTDPVPNITGSVFCENAALPGKVALTDVKMNFLWREDLIYITKINAKAWGGKLEGEFKADHEKPGIPCDVQILVSDVDANECFPIYAPKFLKKDYGEIHGRVMFQARCNGSWSRLQASTGQARLEIRDAQLNNFRELMVLGSYLKQPSFDKFKLGRFAIDCVLEKEKLKISQVQILSPSLELRGHGIFDIHTRKEDLQMKLCIAKKLAELLPAETLEGSSTRKDGFVEVPFYMKGPWERPENDLSKRFEMIKVRAVGAYGFDTIFRAIPDNK